MSLSAAELAQFLQLLQAQRTELQHIRQLLGTPVTLAALQLPLDAAVLNDMINAAGIPGVATAGVNKFSVVVPAGATVSGTVPARVGYVTVSTAPLQVTATYYNPLITLRAWIDGQELTSTDYPYTLTGEDQIEFGQYFYSFEDLVLTAANASATNTVITFKSEGLAVERTFFQDFYLPLIRYSYERMKELAQQVNGGRPLP